MPQDEKLPNRNAAIISDGKSIIMKVISGNKLLLSYASNDGAIFHPN